jgi:hypothetical protein
MVSSRARVIQPANTGFYAHPVTNITRREKS